MESRVDSDVVYGGLLWSRNQCFEQRLHRFSSSWCTGTDSVAAEHIRANSQQHCLLCVLSMMRTCSSLLGDCTCNWGLSTWSHMPMPCVPSAGKPTTMLFKTSLVRAFSHGGHHALITHELHEWETVVLVDRCHMQEFGVTTTPRNFEEFSEN